MQRVYMIPCIAYCKIVAFMGLNGIKCDEYII